MKRACNHCNKEYEADERNLKRDWGLCCSKSCAASMREKANPGYNSARVAKNNVRRDNWNGGNYDNSISHGVTMHDWNFDDMYGHFSNEDN